MSLCGSYAAPPAPDWGWQIEISWPGPALLRKLMFNLAPQGQSEPAVEATYTRQPAPAAADEACQAAEMRLSQLGQVALAVSDVAAALHFYRDVLGLRFLFSAGPNLAFLAAGDVRIMLTLPQGAGKAGANSILYF
jgi:hypothetical protein